MPECFVATLIWWYQYRAATIAVNGTHWRILDQERRPTRTIFPPGFFGCQPSRRSTGFHCRYADTAAHVRRHALAAAFPVPCKTKGLCLHCHHVGPDSKSLCPLDLASRLASPARHGNQGDERRECGGFTVLYPKGTTLRFHSRLGYRT